MGVYKWLAYSGRYLILSDFCLYSVSLSSSLSINNHFTSRVLFLDCLGGPVFLIPHFPHFFRIHRVIQAGTELPYNWRTLSEGDSDYGDALYYCSVARIYIGHCHCVTVTWLRKHNINKAVLHLIVSLPSAPLKPLCTYPSKSHPSNNSLLLLASALPRSPIQPQSSRRTRGQRKHLVQRRWAHYAARRL